MSKRNWIALVAGLAFLLVAGGLFASNMGFKLNYPMDGPDALAVISASGTNTLALPYNQQTSLTDADTLKTDLTTAAGVGDAVVSISQHVKSDDSLVTYTGFDPAKNFTLQPGEGYRVVLRTSVSLVNLIVVGSHDPGKVVDLISPSVGVSSSGTNDFAYPYHGVAADASDLKDEITLQAGVSDAVVSVSKLVRSDDSLITYTGFNPANNFTLTPGNSYRVVMRTSVPGVAYVPQHY